MENATLTPAVFVPAARDRATVYIAGVALAALLFVPWATTGGASALLRAIGGHLALWATFGAAVATLFCALREFDRGTAIASAFAVVWTFGAAFAEGATGPSFGFGAAIALTALTVCFARAIARRGAFGGDPTVAAIVVVIAVLLAIFIFYPVAKSLLAALFDNKGTFAPQLAVQRLLTEDIWGLGCLGGGTRCGVAINSALLATIVGIAVHAARPRIRAAWYSAAAAAIRAC